MTEFVTPLPKVSQRGRRQKGSRLERRVAKAINGQRTGNALGTADVTHDRFSVECKARASLPALISKAFDQALAAIPTGSSKAPLVVIKPDYGPAVYCLRESDFLALSGSDTSLENTYRLRQKLQRLVSLAKEALDEAR